MKIQINASKIDMTPSLKKYATAKMEALGKFVKRFEKEAEADLYLELARSTKHHKSGDVFYAEATLALPKKNIRAEEYDPDIRAAIDMVKDTLAGEVTRYKDAVVEGSRPRRTK